MTSTKPRVRVKMGRRTLNQAGLRILDARDRESPVYLPMSIKGDCGLIHPSVQDWVECHACNVILLARKPVNAT